MFGLSQSVGYAISALVCLENNSCGTSHVREIACCSKVPAAYLAKLFKKLGDSGLLVSWRGRAGGTKLARPPAEISLFAIAEAIDGQHWLDRCLLGLEECTDARACPTHHFWKTERAKIAFVLQQTTLADVIAFERSKAAGTRSSPKARRSRTTPARGAESPRKSP